MNLDQIRDAVTPLRQSLLQHSLYVRMDDAAALRTFMEQHVFAVWDFMSLLKALQQRLCCTTVPWVPSAHPAASRLINEIVLGEESDEDGRGGHASHFELYRRSMIGFGADTARIDRLTAGLRDGLSLEAALRASEVNEAVARFVQHTFQIIATGDLCRIASAFTFGREDLLPSVFQKIVDQLDRQTGGGLTEFQFYLKRHIDLDGGEHGPMATRLVADLCGDDPAKWNAAREAAVSSLQARLDLWNAISEQLN